MKKKALVVFLALSMLSAEMFCTSAPAFAEETAAESGTTASDSEEAAEPGTTASDSEKSAAASVMSYEEFIEAALDSPVTVETYVQAKQAWIKDSSAANLYTQNEEGAYFIYKLPMTKKEYKKLKEGQKIRISGRKHQWLGNIEIAGVSFEILEGSYIAEAQDITDLLGTEDLADYKNRKVCFKGMKSVDFEDPGGDLLRYAYGPDGNGDRGDDLYFCAETGNEIQTPSRPKNRGKTSNTGSRNSNCLDNERKMLTLALPMLWKKLVMTICTPMIGRVTLANRNPCSAMPINCISEVKALAQ